MIHLQWQQFLSEYLTMYKLTPSLWYVSPPIMTGYLYTGLTSYTEFKLLEGGSDI